MKYPRYNVNEFIGGHNEYTTPCPFDTRGKTGDVIMVGSLACERCQYFKSIKKKDAIVFCDIM